MTFKHYRTLLGVAVVAVLLICSPSKASSQVSGAPPAALLSAIESFATLSGSDTITWWGYTEVSLCPVGRTCLTNTNAYLVEYSVGDNAETAIAIVSNTQTCGSCYTYNVLYAAGGPMDVPTLESIGIDPTTGGKLLQ